MYFDIKLTDRDLIDESKAPSTANIKMPLRCVEAADNVTYYGKYGKVILKDFGNRNFEVLRCQSL